MTASIPATKAAQVHQPPFRAADPLEVTSWLAERLQLKQPTLLTHAKHLCGLWNLAEAAPTVLPFDPDDSVRTSLKALAKVNLLQRLELADLNGATTYDPTWPVLPATTASIADWLKARENLLGQGRGKAISNDTAWEVWHAAGSRCMYRGCAHDVGHTVLTTKTARAAYLAHIVASDQDGPRGNAAESHALSDCPENIMLMCDEHHRLIDRIDQEGHSVAILRTMRSEHAERVTDALNALSFPPARLITLLADIANVPTNASDRDLRDATIARRLTPVGPTTHAIRRTQRDSRTDGMFWNQLLHEHELHIRHLITLVSNHAATATANDERLAFFPLHLVPILVMSGRIVGEARPIEVFQYQRNHMTWRWAEDGALPDGAFQVACALQDPADEVLLTIELTANADLEAIPAVLMDGVRDGRVRHIRITALDPNPNCIRHQDDLRQFAEQARHVIAVIQDRIRAKRVHLIGVSPPSSLFRFGQMLQAGHHPEYWVYDRPSNEHHFRPALSISGHTVRAAGLESTADLTTITLR